MIGILLLNVGTPIAATPVAVREYLQEFLMDPQVITLPFLLRWILVKLIIIPFRVKKSVAAYKSIWSQYGSPLLLHSENIVLNLQEKLGTDYKVVLGMRYSSPSIATAIATLEKLNCKQIITVPLFPQYSTAATGTAIAAVKAIVNNDPKYKFIKQFFDNPSFIVAWSSNINRHLNLQQYDHLLFSYHGLPEKIGKEYQKQCVLTSELIAQQLNLDSAKYSTAFQSRLGFTKWLTPYTDVVVQKLYDAGVRNLAICCPAFVADCLETLEEIGMRLQTKWQNIGGKNFQLIPCLNSNMKFIFAIEKILSQEY